MKTGDFVSGAPASERFRKRVPVVLGFLEITDADFQDEEWQVYTINAEYADGDTCPVEVDPDTIKTAPESESVTVFPLPGSEET